jgi:hypothetical protein
VTDEKYLFVTDSAYKKRIGNSYRNRKTHAGRGGKVRLPHDNLTKKELEKMNGECQTCRLNDPMTWAEFKQMPDDLKTDYIKLIRNRYGVSDKFVAENMLGVTQATFGEEVRRLGLGTGKGYGNKLSGADKEGFLVWVNGVEVPVDDEVEVYEKDVFEHEQPEPIREFAAARVVPVSGDLTFTGAAEDVLAAVADILGGAKVRINVMWEVCEG